MHNAISSVVSGMARETRLWQLAPLSPEGFARLISNASGTWISDEEVLLLWRLGLLRADLVTAATRQPDWPEVWNDGDLVWHADRRTLAHRPQGWIDAQPDAPAYPEVTPLFHPFRLAVVVHLCRAFRAGIHELQYLISSEGGARIQALHRRNLELITAQPGFLDQVVLLTDAVEWAVLAEPHASQYFSRWRRGWSDLEEHERVLDAYWSGARSVLQKLTKSDADRFRAELCHLANSLDGNDTIRTMARMMTDSARERISGPLAGALLLDRASETIRRGLESTLGEEIPEEDELLHGPMMRDIKTRLYGTHRLRDGKHETRRRLGRHLGLGGQPRVRWYLEGDTEMAAARWMFDGDLPIDLVPLRGVGKLDSREFREQLKADHRGRIFSVVSVDGDRQSTEEALRRVVTNGTLCGVIAISDDGSGGQDFEMANFDRDELSAALVELARRSGIAITEMSSLELAIAQAGTAKEMFHLAEAVCNGQRLPAKGELWGTILGELSLGETTWAQGHRRREERVFVETVRTVLRATEVTYEEQKKREPVIVLGRGMAERLRLHAASVHGLGANATM
jgi:hypothetical protein